MSQEERVQRLNELSGLVGEMRSVFDRETLLRESGILDPALNPHQDEEGNELELPEFQWLDWEDDNPLTHNIIGAQAVQPAGTLVRRMYALGDAEEDEAIIQVPLHNCLVLYFAEDLDDEDSIERQEAVADFARSQHAFLDNWCRFHGPLPPMLRSLLCDFSLEGPDVRTKMALWLLWLADNSAPGSYWHDTISRHLPPISGMAQPEFCTAEEIKELQWPPYAVPAAARRDALTHFWWEFGGGDMVELLGWRRRQGNEELDEKLFQAVAEAELMKLKTQAPQGEDDAAMEAREKVAEVLREIERVEAEHAAADAAAGLDEQGLRPLPPAEAFVWAYVNAEAHALGNGQRIVFMAQADPCLYTTDLESINTTLAVVAGDEFVDEFAVVATLRAVREGEQLLASPPVNPEDGGSSSHLHGHFGHLTHCAGNVADTVNLQPDVGTLSDLFMKNVLGQETAARLSAVTDPRLRHLLWLEEQGEVDLNQLPPIRGILPPLQIPKLWGPGLVAGVRRLRLEEVRLHQPAEEELTRAGLEEEEQVAAEFRAARAASAVEEEPIGLMALEPREPGTTTPVTYEQYDEWKRTATDTTEIVEVPGDKEQLKTPEGRAEWRRTLAAWFSLPRASMDTKAHGAAMERALDGAPLEQVFLDPRDVQRELQAAITFREQIQRILAFFPTTIEEDEQLLAAATANAAPLEPVWGETPDVPTSAPPADEPEPPVAGSKRRGGKRKTAEAAAAAAAAPSSSSSGTVAPVSPRVFGALQWRLEFKRVWRAMEGIVGEYVESLEQAVKAVEAEAAVGAGR